MNIQQINIVLTDKLPPIEKIAEFTLDNLNYKVITTDNILIKFPDDTYGTNPFGHCFQIIAKVMCGNSQWRYESNVFYKSDYSINLWNEEIYKIVSEAKQYFGEKNLLILNTTSQ